MPSLGVGSATSALRHPLVKGSGWGSVMPRDGLDFVEHVIADAGRVHGRIGDELKTGGTAAPDSGRPGEAGAAVDAEDVLPATRCITVARGAESRGALE